MDITDKRAYIHEGNLSNTKREALQILQSLPLVDEECTTSATHGEYLLASPPEIPIDDLPFSRPENRYRWGSIDGRHEYYVAQSLGELVGWLVDHHNTSKVWQVGCNWEVKWDGEVLQITHPVRGTFRASPEQLEWLRMWAGGMNVPIGQDLQIACDAKVYVSLSGESARIDPDTLEDIANTVF